MPVGIRDSKRNAITLLERALPGIVQLPDMATVVVEIGYARSRLGEESAAGLAVRRGREIAANCGIHGSLCESQPGWDLDFKVGG